MAYKLAEMAVDKGFILNIEEQQKAIIYSKNAGIDNLTDVRYRPYSSGLVAPSRNFILAIQARF